MDTIFITLLNMSITAGYIIIAVVLLRLLIKKAPKWTHCLLWGMVGTRLVFPFSIKSIFSLIPNSEAVPANILQTYIPAIDSNIALNQATSGIPGSASAATVDIMQGLIHTDTVIWLAGIAGLLIYGIISYINLHS